MRLPNHGGQQRGSAAVRAFSEVGGDVVLLFLMPAQAGGGRRNLLVAEVEAKMGVGANSEEVK